MKKLTSHLPASIVILLLFFFPDHIFAQGNSWPKTILTTNGGKIILYQPQPEKLMGNNLSGRAAVSVREKPGDDPIFGAIWFSSTVQTDRDTRLAVLDNIRITDVKIPGLEDEEKIEKLRFLLETEIPQWELEGSIDEIIASMEQEQSYVSEDLKNDPPKILYSTEPSLLVLIDGQPRLKDDENMRMKRVINTPFLILQSNEDAKFYLYGGNTWYVSSSVTGKWHPATYLPQSMQTIDKQVREKEEENNSAQGSNDNNSTQETKNIIVSTEPAEILQTTGVANYLEIQGTGLLYVSNSDDDIFMDTYSQRYFVLLSGRWYTASKLEGPWNYVSADDLPGDFSRIPKGSPKDAVLASVSGTDASREAIMDAQVPQTAKVNRATATCSVIYNGEPVFENIEGTNLMLAVNTSSTVMKSGNRYFCVENGVWFESSMATGPWRVSDERPSDVDRIPASSEAYNTKYVYIYETTPDYVYSGYTPGYMGSYVYGPTVVYGTGYYYNPWFGSYYYPRHMTYGFGMHYNPWTGWSMGFYYNMGCFNYTMYGGGYGGWWGPPVYRPPYRPPYYGYYGRRPVHYNNYTNSNINSNRTNNIYNQRNGVTTRDVNRSNINRSGSTTISTGDTNRPAGRQPNPNRGNNNVYTDRQGNVYQQRNSGTWQQRDGNQWRSTGQKPQQMDRQSQMRNRSQERTNSYQQMNRGGNIGGNYNRSSGAGTQNRGSGGGRSTGGSRRP